jgi:hypothetical protein
MLAERTLSMFVYMCVCCTSYEYSLSFWSLPIIGNSKEHENKFLALDLPTPSGERRETPTLSGPIERGNLNRWIPSPEDGNKSSF